MATSAISATGANTNIYQTTDITGTSNTTGTQSTQKHHHHAKGSGNGQPPSVSSMVSQLQSKLGLNDNQVISLTTLLQKDFAALNPNSGSNSTNATNGTNGTNSTNGTTTAPTKPSQSDMQARKAAFGQINSDIMSVLTPAQQQSFSVLFNQDNNGSNN